MTQNMVTQLRGKTITEATFMNEGYDQVLEIKFEDGSSLYIGPDDTLGVGAYSPEELDEENDSVCVNMRFGFSFRLHYPE